MKGNTYEKKRIRSQTKEPRSFWFTCIDVETNYVIVLASCKKEALDVARDYAAISGHDVRIEMHRKWIAAKQACFGEQRIPQSR